MTASRLSSISAAFVLALAGLNMNATEVDFSYTYGDQDFDKIGTGKAETYDIAIRLSDPSLVGSKIKSVNVPFVIADNIADISVWASKELTLEKKVNVPDIVSYDVESVDGVINFTFPEMVEIPEGGLYLGYTFTVTKKGDASDKPIVVAGAPYADGLYMHTNRTYLKWKSYAATMGHSSAITVTLDGDFQANALGVSAVKNPLATPGEETTVTATLVNHGSEPISSIEYTVGGIGNDEAMAYSFDVPMDKYFGEPFSVTLPFNAPTTLAEYPVDLTITKVNGVENLDKANSGSAILLVLNEVPIHKPLLEEYTGLWCGWCPRGFVGLERMNTLHPDDFVAISYHNGDAMERTTNFPSAVSGFPAAYMDRIYDIDAYYGDSYDEDFGIEPFWKSIQDEFSPVVVNGYAEESEDGSINVTSNISFVKSASGSYKVAYAIAANGLTDASWGQSNYYSGDDSSQYVPEMEKFCNGGSYVYDLVFDDVYAAGSNLKGEPDSLIENVVKDYIYTHDYNFAADAGMSTSNYDLFANAKELYAVIIVLDERGAVVNSNKVLVESHQPTAVGSIEAEGVVKAEYYDLSGRRIANPSKGIFVKVATMENGEKVASKIVVK